MEYLFAGAGGADVVLFVIREVLGLFFVLARFRYVYDPSRPDNPWFNAQRHANFKRKLGICGWPENTGLAHFVAFAEILGGLALIIGFLTPLAGFGLLIISIFAMACSAREKTYKQNPVDGIHVAECFLWTPEPLYVVLAAIVMAMGAGAFSVDAVILGLLR